MNWEVILWTCITISVLLLICGIVIIIFSTVNMKKRREIVSDGADFCITDFTEFDSGEYL